MYKDKPHLTLLCVEMDSISIKDPNVRKEVRNLNPEVKFTKENEISEHVLMTLTNDKETTVEKMAEKLRLYQIDHQLGRNKNIP